MKKIVVCIFFIIISVYLVSGQKKFIWIRVVPDNYFSKEYAGFPYRIIFPKDSILKIRCLKVQCDTISLEDYKKIRQLYSKCQICAEQQYNLVVFTLDSLRNNFSITNFSLYNPWGYSQSERVDGTCLSEPMNQIMSIYYKRSEPNSTIKFDEMYVVDNTRLKAYKLMLLIKIK